MNTKKRVVYDSKNYFSRFLKYEFRKSFKFDSFKNFDSFENEINNYSVIVFVIYSEDELVNFMKIYKKGIPLIVCTFNEKLLLKMRSIDEILLLDTSKIKSEVIIELKSYLNLVNFSSVDLN
ncbi:hypothetical protein [Flavobacterium sp.]|uniref:hypothetical protein n=1 Tax=Flavobacterium sp. TaxID=239 RepID=UPI00379BA3D8